MATYPDQQAAPVVETTPGGTTYERVTVTTSTGDDALLTVPSSRAAGSTVTLVIAAHGYGGSHNTFETHAPSLGIRDRMTDDGYVFISPNMHGDTWGNRAALDDIAAARAYADGVWTVANVLLFGGSMGGLSVVQALAHAAVADVRAVAAVAPALNLRAAYDHASPSYKASIEAAYGVTADGANYGTQTAGHDPVLHTADQYAGARVRLYHSPSDTAIPKVDHSDVFVSNGVTGQMVEFQLLNTSGGHLDAGNYDAANTSAFFAAALSPGAPVAQAVQSVKAWTGAEWAPGTPKVWTGAGWVEARPSGYVSS